MILNGSGMMCKRQLHFSKNTVGDTTRCALNGDIMTLQTVTFTCCEANCLRQRGWIAKDVGQALFSFADISGQNMHDIIMMMFHLLKEI